MLDIQARDLAHAKGVFDEQAHQQLVSGFQEQIVRAAARQLWPGGLGFEAQRLRLAHRSWRGLFGALACGNAATGTVHVQVAPCFPAIPFHGQQQFQRLIGNRPCGVGQAAVLPDDGKAMVECTDGVPLFQKPRAEALEQTDRHAPPGFAS